MVSSVVVALFRHGLTEGNVRKQYIGWTDSLLIKEGENKLFKLQPFINDYDGYISSDLQRCIQTCKLLFPTVEPIVLNEFRELNFGRWEEQTYEQLKDDLDYQKWLTDPFLLAPPNGESFSDFSKRIDDGWKKVIALKEKHGWDKIAIITHGGVIRYLLSKYAPITRSYWDWPVIHGKGYELTWEANRLKEDVRCTLLQEVPITEKQNG